MFLVCGNFDPSRICHAVFDNDNTLIDYKSGEVVEFSYYTAVYAKKKATELLKNPESSGSKVPTQLQTLIETSVSDLRDSCIRAYKKDGSTTEWLRAYDLDPLDVYVGHHDLIVEDVIAPDTYQIDPDVHLRIGLLRLQQMGIGTSVFTNGTYNYADKKLQKARLRDCFNAVIGIDLLAEKNLLSTKYMRKAWIDFLEQLKIPSMTGYVIGKTNDVLTSKDKDWSNCVFVDDDPRVLKVAKSFGFQTVLKITDRVDWQDYNNCDYVDVITDDLPHLCHVIASSQNVIKSQCDCSMSLTA